MSDRIPNRRTPFILGLILAFASTLCFALGTTLPILLSARLLEGLSTAIVATVGYTLMREVVGQERLGRATGFTSMSFSMGLLLGPVMGGVLYEYAGYFQTFVPALALLAVELGLRLLIIEDRTQAFVVSSGDTESEGGKGKRTADDTKGIIENQGDTRAIAGDTGTSECPPSAMESQPLLPNTPPPTPPPAATGNLYVTLLTNPRFLTSVTGVFILNSTACGFDAVLGPYINSAFSFGPVHVAALFLTLAVPMLFSPLTGILTDRFGPKIVASTGLVIGAPSLAALGLVGPGTAIPMLKLGVLFFFIGISLALSLVPLRVDASAAIGAIEKKRPGAFGPRGAYARAFGLMSGIVSGGGLAGPLVAGCVRIRFGWGGMALTMGGLTLLVLGSVVVFTGGSKS